MATLKELVEEVVEATNVCPEALRPLAFEMLLKHQLTRLTPAGTSRSAVQLPSDELVEENRDGAQEGGNEGDEEVTQKDLHAKTRKFLADTGLTLDDVNALYYKEGSDIKPLYDDLRSTAMAESQMRLAMLEAFENAIATGTFEFMGESVREKCKVHKCYDGTNFTRNFKNNAPILDGFETYDASAPIRLSAAGRQRLGAVLTELARAS